MSGASTSVEQARRLEALLARLYTDPAWRERFLAEPEAVARQAGLTDDTARALAAIDRDGLVLAADSLAAKRAGHAPATPAGWWSRLRRRWRQRGEGG